MKCVRCAVLVVVVSIHCGFVFTNTAYAQNGEEMVKGIMGFMMNKMQEEMENNDVNEAPVNQSHTSSVESANPASKTVGAKSNQEQAPHPKDIPDELYGVSWRDWPGNSDWFNADNKGGCSATNTAKNLSGGWDHWPELVNAHYQNWGACSQQIKVMAQNIAEENEKDEAKKKAKASARQELADRAGNIVLQEQKRIESSGSRLHRYVPASAIEKAIGGMSNVLIEGNYYAVGRQVEDYFCSMTNPPAEYRVDGECGLNHGEDFATVYLEFRKEFDSGYKISQVLDSNVLYQHRTKDLPPILLTKQKGKLYLEGQSLHLASMLLQYKGTTNYTSVTGASIQALKFEAKPDDKFKEAHNLMLQAADVK